MSPASIGRYEVLRQLGKGGMATVCLARDPFFDRQVAIKVLSSVFSQDPQFHARFEREAKVIAALEHPYIVPVYDYGQEGDQPFLVMRFMPGGNLGERMTGQPLPPADIVALFQRLGEALDEAHRRGIIHRDIKPANVMFDGHDQAYLSDFGIAKLMQASSSFTGAAVLGTPAYMSPEQVQGSRGVDGRSDVYALGVMVYEALSGRRPFDAHTSTELMLKQVSEPVPRLDAALLGLPPECNALLEKALAKEPAQRFATAGELAAAVAGLWGWTLMPRINIPPSQTNLEAVQRTPVSTTAPTAFPRVSSLPLPTARARWAVAGTPWWLLAVIIPTLLLLACGATLTGFWLFGWTQKPSATPTLLARTPLPTLTLPSARHKTATPAPALTPTP
jgi:serine/threonine protein kinase